MHGLIEGPTPNPDERSSNILLRRYDFPVLYIPATEMTPMGPLILLRKSMASGFMANSIQLEMKKEDANG